MIRLATVADLEALTPLAQEFYASTAFLHQFDPEKFQSLWTGLLEAGNGVIFVLESEGRIVGTIGGVAHPEVYSCDLIAQEFFWFVAKEHRGWGLPLYKEFEQWAKEKGCAEIRMGHLSDLNPEKVRRFYQRMGYRQVETNYAKRLVA